MPCNSQLRPPPLSMKGELKGKEAGYSENNPPFGKRGFLALLGRVVIRTPDPTGTPLGEENFKKETLSALAPLLLSEP
ncbi:MAG: hypothetical protein ACPL7E_00400 [bacterium]